MTSTGMGSSLSSPRPPPVGRTVPTAVVAVVDVPDDTDRVAAPFPDAGRRDARAAAAALIRATRSVNGISSRCRCSSVSTSEISWATARMSCRVR